MTDQPAVTPERLFFFDMSPEEQNEFKANNRSIVDMWKLAESLSFLPLGFRRYLYDTNTWDASQLNRKHLSEGPHRERLANRHLPAAIETKKSNLSMARLYYLDVPILERFSLEYAEFHRQKAQGIDVLRKSIEFPLSYMVNSDPFCLFLNIREAGQPVIVCTHCEVNAMSFGSVYKFHEHFKEHGVLTAYGCHQCLHLFHTREMWEQHQKGETCSESSDAPLSASLYGIACVGCGFMFVYNPLVTSGPLATKQLGDLLKIQNCHFWDEMVMFRLVTTEKEEEQLASEVHVNPRKWTGVTYLPEKHARCRNICGVRGCGTQSSSFSDHIAHTEKHCGKQRVRLMFTNFLNELVNLNPVVKHELKWRRRRARVFPKSLAKSNSTVPREKKMPDGARHVFSVNFDPNPALPGICKTSSRISLCRQCQMLTVGSKQALTHARDCYNNQDISAGDICYSDKYATVIWEYRHVPNSPGSCPIAKCQHRACSIQGFVVHMLTKHGVQVSQDLSHLQKFEQNYREPFTLRGSCLKTMEVNQQCLLTYDGHFPIEGTTWSKLDYTSEELLYKEDGVLDLSTPVPVQEIGEKEESLVFDKTVYKSKTDEEDVVPNQEPVFKEPVILEINQSLLDTPLFGTNVTLSRGEATIPESISIEKKKSTEEDRQKRKRNKKLVANIEAMPKMLVESGPSKQARAAQKAEQDEAFRKHQNDPIPYNFKRLCFDCGLTLKDEPSLKKHLQEHSQRGLNPLDFSCCFCDQILNNLSAYYEHMYRIHSKPNFDPNKTVAPVCCSLCANSRTFETLPPHLRFECTYSKYCGICKFKLYDVKDGKVQLFKRSQRDKHMRKHQEQLKRFLCVCGSDFPHFTLYKNHVCEKKEIGGIRLSLTLLDHIIGPEEVVKWITSCGTARRPTNSAANENVAQDRTSKAADRHAEKRTALNDLTSFKEPPPKRPREDDSFQMPGPPQPSMTVPEAPPASVVCLNAPSVICLDQPDPYAAISLASQHGTMQETVGAAEIIISSQEDDDIMVFEPESTSKASHSNSVDDDDDDEIMVCDPSEPSNQAREKKFKCSLCSQSFYIRTSLEHHFRTSHAQDVSARTKRIHGTYGIPIQTAAYFCPVCMYAFQSQESHLEHMSGHSPGILFCDYCSGTSGSLPMMVKHLTINGHGLAPASVDPGKEQDTRSMPIPGEFWCTNCSPCLVFATDYSLYLHLVLSHKQTIFHFCKTCLFGSVQLMDVLQHIRIGMCGCERRPYERTLGFVLAKALHYHPEDEEQHKAIMSMEENRNKFMTPNDCSQRSTLRFSTRMATCHEVHEDGQKCYLPMNFFHFENFWIQHTNQYVADASSLPDESLPARLFVDPKWNMLKWIELNTNIFAMKTSREKWSDFTQSQYPRSGNPVPVGSHTLTFRRANAFPHQPRIQQLQPVNNMGQVFSPQQQQMMHQRLLITQQQRQIPPQQLQTQESQMQLLARYQQQQQQAQGQQQHQAQAMANQQGTSHVQAMLGHNGRGAWQGPHPQGDVAFAPTRQQAPVAQQIQAPSQIHPHPNGTTQPRQHGTPVYQQHAQQGSMMHGVQPAMRIPPTMAQQAQFATMPQQMVPEQYQHRQHPQQAPFASAQRNQEAVHAQIQRQQPSVASVQNQGPVQVQLAAGPSQPRQYAIPVSQQSAPASTSRGLLPAPSGREFAPCAICERSTPKSLLVSLPLLNKREEYIKNVLSTTSSSVPVQEKQAITLRLKTLNSVCFKHVNPWGVSILAHNGEFYTKEPNSICYLFAESHSPALNSGAYLVLLNDQINKILSNQIDLDTFLKRLRVGTQCNIEGCRSILKTSAEASLHAFHSRPTDRNGTVLLCAMCKNEYRNEEDMLHHIIEAHVFPRGRGHPTVFELDCPICGVGSPSLDIFRTHLVQHHKLLASSSCPCVFANLIAKNQHDRKHHSAQNNRCCMLCGESDIFEPFTAKNVMITHHNSHSLNIKFTCRICFESTTSHAKLVEHCQQTHRINARCDFCSVNLSSDQRGDHIALRHELRLYSLRGSTKVTTPEEIRDVLGLP